MKVKHRLSIILFPIVSLVSACSVYQGGGSKNKFALDADYKLVWSDEFDTEGAPDTANWRFENGFVRNQELQWYQTENARCVKGVLLIEGRKESKANPGFEQGSADWRKKRQNIEYTASSLNTSGKHSWKYGRFVMRGRIDISDGLWPAWWTLGDKGQWPANGEIDILEYYNKKLLFNIACTGTDKKVEWYTRTKATNVLGGQFWASSFHIWRMDWDEHLITLYLDDEVMNSVEVSRLFNKDGSGVNPFRQPQYMLLNLALGGANGGDPSTTNFPKRFEVDYVRVYQRK